MEKLVIDLDVEDKTQVKTKTLPNCWICLDDGLAIYYKRQFGIRYEVACKCRCKEGQVMSEDIPTVPSEISTELIDINFTSFKDRHPELIAGIKEG